MSRLVRFAIPAAVVLLVWLALPWLQGPATQVQQRQKHLLALAEDRDWDAVTQCLALEYEDQWSQNRTDAVELAQELLSGFIVLDIEWTTTEITVNGTIAKVRGIAKISGNGAGASPFVKERVNQVKEPWVFTWRQDGWRPADWKLLSLKNTGLGGPLPEHALR